MCIVFESHFSDAVKLILDLELFEPNDVTTPTTIEVTCDLLRRIERALIVGRFQGCLITIQRSRNTIQSLRNHRSCFGIPTNAFCKEGKVKGDGAWLFVLEVPSKGLKRSTYTYSWDI